MIKNFFWLLLCLFPLQVICETKINDVQILATHNSFKEFMDYRIKNIIETFCSLSVLGLEDYQHLPFLMQLDKGVRGFEIDVFADTKGGKYSDFHVLSKIGYDGAYQVPDLDKSGFKVMHDPNFDFRSSCYLFKDCLRQILAWSNEYPNHLPFFMHIQIRDQPTPIIGESKMIAEILNLVIPTLMTEDLLSALDEEIKSIIPIEKIITPDQFRGEHETLRAAALANAWPGLSSSRGKFIFYMDADPNVQSLYLDGHPNLNNRIIFTTPTDPEADDAAFLIYNDPLLDKDKITELVKRGYIVRTRADSGTTQAYANDTTNFEAALESGAQIISTDYIVPAKETGTNYFAFIPEGNPGRCSPARNTTCDPAEINE